MPSALKTSTLWCAAIARPDSLTIIGCSISRALQTLRDAVHDVARVLVERVVHRRCEVGAAAVVVDAEAAADVDVLEAGAHQLELGVDVRELVDGVLDAADVLQLAARMAVHELQAVEHAVLACSMSTSSRISVTNRPNLRFLAGRVAPAPGAFARELDAHADARPHLVLLGVLAGSAAARSKFSTTGMMVRPSLVARITASM